jgi:hypothetical protein
MRSPRMRTLRQRAVYKLTVLVTVILLLDLLFLIYSAGEAHAATPRRHHHSIAQQQDQDQSGDGDQPSDSPDPSATPDDSAVQALSNQGPAQTIQIQLTGYARADNTPPDSTTISMPVIHQQAGGTCTYADPTTFASPGSAGSTEFPRGQRVYIPKIRCYGISEDSGATAESVKHIDFYVGNGPASETGPCEDQITGPTSIIVNPPPGEPVTAGEVATAAGCRSTTTGTSTGAPDATDAPSGHARHTKHATADSGDDG